MRTSDGFPAKSASLAIGLLSLGAETLWVRIFSFMGRSTPLAVSIILGTYLLGIAFGAVLGAWLCRRQDEKKLAASLIASLLLGSIIVLASPLMLITATKSTTSHSYSIILPAVTALSLAFLSSFVFSICFPICHHLGTRLASGNVGKGMSRVYAANIAGSVIGPLLVNFVILQFATTELAFAILGILGVAVGILLLGFAESRKPLKLAAATCVLLAVASVFAMARSDNWLIRSLASKPYDPDASRVFEVSRVIETRQGIIVSYRDDKSGDIIYGGNVYDGRTNLDPRLNSNNINRVLVLAALRPNPKKVLVIGLSVGSWNYLISGFPGVEQIDVVEINPGYLRLMTDYPRQNEVMNDPRVRLHIGDGRRFLRKIPEGTYDLVVMNTSFHWRAYVSMLLSKEFLTLARSRMAPGALLAFNTTGSRDALYTAASVFPHAYLYDNFAVCADFDWRAALEKPEAVRELMMVSPAGTALFSNDDGEFIKGFLSRSHTADVAGLSATIGRPLEVITDRNLITEHKYGRPLRTTDMGDGR